MDARRRHIAPRFRRTDELGLKNWVVGEIAARVFVPLGAVVEATWVFRVSVLRLVALAGSV
jgi:hypothetical protein